MIITFFNDKPECGKSTLTLHTARTLLNLFHRKNENKRRVFIFDTANKVKNSLVYKKNQERTQMKQENQTELIIEYLNDYQDFEFQKIEFNIKENDVVFFDLQNFGEKQFDFLIKSNYVIVVSDSPNELERVDREMYYLMEKLKNYSQSSISFIKKIFLTQNRVSFSEQILEDFEQVNYITGLEELEENWKIENISDFTAFNPPMFIQKFVLDVWKKINDYQEQVII